jgi:hypothetical protein
MTTRQRAHLVVALGVVNLCLAAMGLAIGNLSRSDISANRRPSAEGHVQVTPGSSRAPSDEPGPIGSLVAEVSSPPPLPEASRPDDPGRRTLSGDDFGLVTVSPGRPLATVTVTIRANEAAFVAQGEPSLSVLIQGTVRRPGRAGELPTPVAAAITRLDSTARQISWSSGPVLEDRLDRSCPTIGECIQSYRIVVALVDPAVRTATFAWTAAARAVLDRGVFPSDARLTVKATHPATIGRAATALDSLAVQRVQLDAGHQRLVREVTIDLPDGLNRETLAGMSFRAAIKANTAKGLPSGVADIAVSFEGHRLKASRPGDVAPFLAFDPFLSCRAAKPCQLILRLEFRRLSADTAPLVAIEWALSVWAADPRPLARAPGLSLKLGRSSKIALEPIG